ncbi:zinc finger protein CONSTANS-LIKE 16-like [Durio zibethinus]|uniref:Zinc finger protein CONSTANS-LIKE 16-like n=1 Tax=Durio zibethinus TaxID=66656 RepID=A0A6P5YC35_DURZI|nr:zinc finger protein CONSTANS-LIKE 16-like [Durio zibethinus]
MISDKRAANAMGGKTARACDGCMRKRARWYCAADDAFLCHGCDTSVHSANQLASRHERVRLEIASSTFNDSVMNGTTNQDAPPAWHQGFTRKARTPRHSKSMSRQQKGEGKVLNLNQLDPLVPEIGSEDGSVDENEEQLFCRVPVFDPFSAELGNMVTSDGDEVPMVNEDGNLVFDYYGHEETCEQNDDFHGFLPSDLDLAEFAADVESLLGVGPDEDTCDNKRIELLDCKEEEESNVFHGGKIMKVKDEEGEEEKKEGKTACCCDSAFDVARASLNWSFDYESPTIDKEEEKVVPTIMDGQRKTEMKRNMLLRLNYESVITAWASQGSPWTSGSRPEFNPDYFMGSNPKEGHHLNGGIGGIYRQARGNTDEEREARVSRYREKRRTRLFSKKIRYEVRKLNAEKRPRMKGRFVKRTSFGGTAFPYVN